MTIAEVSAKYGLPEDTLRYYERIGLIPPVNRRRSGIRDYTDEDCRWVEFVKCMRGAGLSIETLIEYLRLYQIGNGTVGARKELLIEQRALLRSRIEAMQGSLARLDGKIARYERLIAEGVPL